MSKGLTKTEADKLSRITERFKEDADWLRELSEKYRDWYDERSENWQESDAGSDFSTWLDSLGDLSDNAQTLIDDLEGFSTEVEG